MGQLRCVDCHSSRLPRRNEVTAMALLDSTPPSPQLQTAQAPSLSGLVGPGGPGGGELPGVDIGGIIQVGQQVDESILLLAQAIPSSAPELSQARELVKQALAKALAAAPPAAGGPSPVETGAQFPGSSIGRGEP